jgi:hypothetical protein
VLCYESLTLPVGLDLVDLELGPAKIDELVDEHGEEGALCDGAAEGLVEVALGILSGWLVGGGRGKWMVRDCCYGL